MNHVTCWVVLTTISISGAAFGATEVDKSNAVAIVKTDRGFELRRNGEPFFIKGAGGRSRMEDLAAAGGNAIRTWHVDRLQSVLDDAQRHNLAVAVGIWLGHERHGFDYANSNALEEQRKVAFDAVREFKDHPAVLCWGIGNEMEGDGSNPLIWKEVNHIAKTIKAIDPNHPTMTVIAGVGHDKISSLIKHCPDIDMVGINAYGDLSKLPEEAKEQGLDRPYIVTEFGPFGWWQVEKTSWGAEPEPTSTEKARTYHESYRAAVTGEPELCLGAFTFLWGHKQEHTHTWFGLFLPTGERTEAVDVMTRLWSGKWPANRCPRIETLEVKLDGDQPQPAEHIYQPATRLRCSVAAIDPDGDKLEIKWELLSESSDKRSGGDPEEKPPAHPEAIIEANNAALLLQLPESAGAYRLFVYVLDGNGNAATANVPILVR